MSYPQLTQESFQRKLAVFGITLKTRKEIERYPRVSLAEDAEMQDPNGGFFDRISEAYTWLDENLGDTWIWSSSMSTGRPDIYFLNSDDVLFFRLRFKTFTTT